MIKKTTLALLLLCTIFSYAQEEEDQQQNFSEWKLNAFTSILGAPEITFERTLNDESAIGASLLVPLESLDTTLNYYFSPYYRFYFGEKYAAGFFIEGFGMLSSEEKVTFLGAGLQTQEENVTDFALGIAVGGKWVTKRGFVAELSLGVGRNLFNSDESLTEIVGKLGITVGYRF